jgi:hypothetical protein
VYAKDADGHVRFHRLFPPDDAEVARVTDRIVRRIIKLIARRGLGAQTNLDEADPLRRDQRLHPSISRAQKQLERSHY